MLSWASDRGQGRPAVYDGTFASLVKLYESHPDSPYHELHETTRVTYSRTMASLMKYKGERRVDAVTGNDMRRWYKEIAEANSRSYAYFMIGVLKTVLSFASTLRIREASELREELRAARFKPGHRRHQQLTNEHVKLFCDKAREMGLAWLARCVRLQFDFAMRRRDVIGEYVSDDGTNGIRSGRKVWRDGLTWGHIDGNGIIRKVTSKTAKTTGLEAVHAIADYPDVASDLATTPDVNRIGPLVVNPRTGKPPTEAKCRYHFRVVARLAGIPDDIRQMDARAGANTEAYEAGATEEEAMALATHTERKTNRGYLRDLTEQSRRAAAKRIAARRKE